MGARMVGTAAALTVALPPGAVHAADNPWLGTWKMQVNTGEPPETLVYSDAGDGAMWMVSVEMNSVS